MSRTVAFPHRFDGRPLRIAIVGSARFGVTEPFAGGLESHTVTAGLALQRAGHDVTIFAGPADEPRRSDIDVVPIVDSTLDTTSVERADTQMSPEASEHMDRGYRSAMETIGAMRRFDVIHNNSLHPTPVAFDGVLGVPMVHVLHCPPFDELTDAHQARIRRFGSGSVIAVSAGLGRAWPGICTAVVPNGVPVHLWRPDSAGASSERCVWVGRIVPEKAPHLAIDAARLAGRPIVLAGPVQHRGYFDDEIAPRLGDDATWVGHLCHDSLGRLIGDSAVGVVTPLWDEPFGLVVAEMLACGTPVAATDRGAIASFVNPAVAAISALETPASVAAAIDRAAGLDRKACRRHAAARLSDDRMVESYVAHYRAAIAGSTGDAHSSWPAMIGATGG
ncbi:MAG TPA: glycosyltransferase [Ilumatobacteraceae bacterium]|nr:glycosyltransferase [Ilumatobacteraceae bacterium]